MKSQAEISNRLLNWYKRNGRTLPWRTTFSPYSVWVSEIMLQQTQVDTVIPYYQKFLTSFPTIHSLANASLDQVLKQWEGLGYYSRARNLHRSAQIVRDQFNGKFPNQFQELITLPGIGRSTAGAILSLAYNFSFPILDGNVRRVLSRLFALQIEPGNQLDRCLWEYSASLVPREARSFNSAMMDLGATLCKPKEPLCKVCPLKLLCLGFKKNLQNRLPLKKKREKIPLQIHSALVIWKKNQVLIRKRRESGLLGGLWEFPQEMFEDSSFSGQKKLPEIYQDLGFRMTIQDCFLKLKHTFTHFKMELHVFKGKYQSGKGKKNENQRWVTLDDIEMFPFSTTHKKIIENLRNG